MSSVRVLVGTRKGAFILTSDDKRQDWQYAQFHKGIGDINFPKIETLAKEEDRIGRESHKR